MKITDFMEVTVVDKDGMHKMESTEDMGEYLQKRKNEEQVIKWY